MLGVAGEFLVFTLTNRIAKGISSSPSLSDGFLAYFLRRGITSDRRGLVLKFLLYTVCS
jgi:hypothetical protein